MQLANGGTLKGQTVILSTGARWRNVNVPSEAEYKNKGVAYCPHCDGPCSRASACRDRRQGNRASKRPLTSRRRGGPRHPHRVCRPAEGRRRAGEQAQEPAQRHHPHNAQTTEITGADGKVNGLKLQGPATGEEHLVPLEGVFVQIGLVPNTEWLKGTVELSVRRNHVDAQGHTNVPGVFAAGDCTTVPSNRS